MNIAVDEMFKIIKEISQNPDEFDNIINSHLNELKEGLKKYKNPNGMRYSPDGHRFWQEAQYMIEKLNSLISVESIRDRKINKLI
jgi:DNA replicative helicase MCM subunit Mcm2 (Cdc46/Mcm family)